MDSTAQGWIMKTAQKNLWRVTEWGYDFDDLVQDGWMCAAIVKQKYPEVSGPRKTADQRRQFMALLMRVFTNHIHDLAKGRTRDFAMIDAVTLAKQQPGASACQDAEILTLIAEAPPTIRRALRKLIAADGKLLRAAFRVRPDGTRETTNERLCRIAGVPRHYNLERAIRAYLT